MAYSKSLCVEIVSKDRQMCALSTVVKQVFWGTFGAHLTFVGANGGVLVDKFS